MVDELKFDSSKEESESYSDESLYNIISYGNDMSLRQIVDMYNEGEIEKPDLQRKYVWTKDEASRFIDSVLLGLPVPSIFLAKTKDNRLLIVDGFQRIMTVSDYLKGTFGTNKKEFKLSNKDSIYHLWRGKSFAELSGELQRSIKMYTIHAIVFEQKHPGDDTAMYQIFERINTGGRILKPQEIRNCIYHGNFNNLLINLNKTDNWRLLLNKTSEDPRMLDIELILRFFAFVDFDIFFDGNTNQINLTKFLNEYMALNQYLDENKRDSMKATFINVTKYLYGNIGEKCFKTCKTVDGKTIWSNRINPVVFDSVCYATTVALKNNLTNISNLGEKYETLMTNTDFLAVISERTTNVENIKKRQSIALKVLFDYDRD